MRKIFSGNLLKFDHKCATQFKKSVTRSKTSRNGEQPNILFDHNEDVHRLESNSDSEEDNSETVISLEMETVDQNDTGEVKISYGNNSIDVSGSDQTQRNKVVINKSSSKREICVETSPNENEIRHVKSETDPKGKSKKALSMIRRDNKIKKLKTRCLIMFVITLIFSITILIYFCLARIIPLLATL